MVERKVARKLTEEEVKSWKGPLFYLSHLAVHNPKSASTPVRIVSNSSQTYRGVSLNTSLAKGPDSYITNLLGILLRWRENRVAMIADIKKMYNSIYLEHMEVHCHRFLWRDMDEARQPDTYVIQRVNMGDKPAPAISAEAIRLTAEKFKDQYPRAAQVLTQSTYVDDIVDSIQDPKEAVEVAEETQIILAKAGFRIKHWLFSGEVEPGENLPRPAASQDEEKSTTRVLGVTWDPTDDQIQFEVSINFSQKRRGVHVHEDLTCDQIPHGVPEVLTKRQVLEQTMKFYDPMGLLCPFTLIAKCHLRETWEIKVGWDEALPEALRQKWIEFFQQRFEAQAIRYERALKPSKAVGQPTLIILSDGSDMAYGFAAYLRWQLDGGGYWVRLILAKSRIAPVKKRTTPQMELNGALLAKCGRKVIEAELRFSFERVIHLVDSETVLFMINKLSTRFKLYEGSASEKYKVPQMETFPNGFG